MSPHRDRVVVVTGASGNLGAAVAKAFIAAEAKVVLVDHALDKLTRQYGPELDKGHLAFGVDLSDEPRVRALVDEAHAKLGRIDALVNTVGGYLGGSPVADTEWSQWDHMLTLNVKVAHACNRAVLPHLLARGSGKIIHVASLAALHGSAGESAYAGAKAALLRMTESLSDEVKAKGIQVNAILPGSIDTPQNRTWMSKAQIDLAIDPNAIADVVLFLASDAARAVTGAAIRVSGAQ